MVSRFSFTEKTSPQSRSARSAALLPRLTVLFFSVYVKNGARCGAPFSLPLSFSSGTSSKTFYLLFLLLTAAVRTAAAATAATPPYTNGSARSPVFTESDPSTFWSEPPWV